jgi:hypothetical protein
VASSEPGPKFAEFSAKLDDVVDTSFASKDDSSGEFGETDVSGGVPAAASDASGAASADFRYRGEARNATASGLSSAANPGREGSGVKFQDDNGVDDDFWRISGEGGIDFRLENDTDFGRISGESEFDFRPENDTDFRRISGEGGIDFRLENDTDFSWLGEHNISELEPSELFFPSMKAFFDIFSTLTSRLG